ncbi:MAG: NUDIX domain-containing protein [Pseudomonadota bacterium]
MWSFPGGHVEPGEQLSSALTRELREELAIERTVGRKILSFETDGEAAPPARFHIYCVRSWTGTPQLVGDEHSEMRWVDPSDAARLTPLAFEKYQEVFGAIRTGSLPKT